MLPRIYLDDCADRDELGDRLRTAGFEVRTPRSERTIGRRDSEHLAHAAANGLVLLTLNPKDFRELHKQWVSEGRQHAGILLVYFDNDRRRDAQPADIVRALKRLIQSGLPLTNEIHSLNEWR
jgi:hypothetical protein